MNQYIVQNYNQIIDLFDQIDDDKNLSIKISAPTDFEYALLSREQFDNADFSVLPLKKATSVEKIVNNNHRYLVIRAQNQTVVSVYRAVTTQTAEFFFNDTTSIIASVVLGIVVLVLIGLVCFMIYEKVAKPSQKPLSQVSQAVNNHLGGFFNKLKNEKTSS